MNKNILWFSEVGKEDGAQVGGKGANLGELTKAGIPVPDGFIVTASAYFAFLKETKLAAKIEKILETANLENIDEVNQTAQRIQKEIKNAAFPKHLKEDIEKAWQKLTANKKMFLAVRSSATAEDLPGASFAGQQRTFLNIVGRDQLVKAVQLCWASLFEPRAIFYRREKKFDQMKVGIAVPVQKMVQSETSGIMFTMNPVTNDKNKIIIEAVFGLGELIVQGEVNPDHFEIDKKTFEITQKEIAHQSKALIYKNGRNEKISLKDPQASKQKLPDDKIIELAELGAKIEKHYYFPQDIEWAYENGQIYIVQARPVTTIESVNNANISQVPVSKTPILTGLAAAPGIGSGPVRIILKPQEINKLVQGEVLVTEMTTPDFVPAMKKASAIVTEKGGRTCHAAIVSRELGIPCVVGVEKATKILKNGEVITVSGNDGNVYKGGMITTSSKTITPSKKETPVSSFLKTATKVYVNLAEPEAAEKIAAENVDGVGLLRAEFMIAGIGIHPKKLIAQKREKIFTEELTSGLKKFCEAFYPRPVVYRATDFKTNEYRNLSGGELYEPEEPNPMLGYRGCFRYIHDPAVFKLELSAIKNVRNKFNLRNLWLMIPFVRTVEELIAVKKILAVENLPRSASFKLWMMAEIPSNVILLDKFIETGIDGVSIGSNDLTMLILGTDRDNSEVASEFDERNPAALWAFEQIIKTCHKYHITSSVCGQAPSVFPELTEKLVEWGITSVSVSPDAIDKTRQTIRDAENKLIKEKSVRKNE